MILSIPQAWILQTHTLREANKEFSIQGLLNDRLITRQLNFFNHLAKSFCLFWKNQISTLHQMAPNLTYVEMKLLADIHQRHVYENRPASKTF
tara:strand:+ start:170 stop:448 length:279 start_codon:yes stop_codon:yes gene_type:complete